MAIKVGINGFGRIGRQAFKAIVENYADSIEVVGINDLFTPSDFALLLRYDSVYGIFQGSIETTEDSLIINGKETKFFAKRDPSEIPWGDIGADIVVESTGVFTSADKASAHLKAGAKKVVISAPAKGEDITIVMGVNEQDYDPAKHTIISNASCTTNCLAPAAKVVNDKWGIIQGMMTTVHSYTGDQRLIDLPHKDPRRARAAALNIIPTTTGAAKAVALVIPSLKGKFDGFALRVPTPTVSIVDFVANLEKPCSLDALIAAFDEAAAGPMKGILGVSHEPLVSMDFKGDTRSSIIDADSCMILGDKMVKVVSWYDNEWGYSNRIADLINYMARKGL
ncbi:MAG: type I glyceraldehyde-3-phosphate dehydrogenase [Chloroflexi bacterium]|jgi:glyceraldehyde 3-phosphate dehydrogenase|nr:type I glyceraldehyde-3-phosphate dehydrogenase [Chloroflexota bacterium]